jgi:predicted lipid-binding transport protein (Tim44 family)
MKHTGILAIVALTLATLVAGEAAEARRMSGGKSLGAQRPSVAPSTPAPTAAAPSAAASQPVMPAQPGATLPAKPVAPATPAPAGASRWLGPIAGLAAGLGLAALLSHFGLPEGLGSFLLLALLVIGGVLVVRMLLARRSPAQGPLAYAGTPGASPRFETPPAPQWGGGTRVEPVLGAAPAPPAATKPLPPEFDAHAFAAQAKLQFIRLQAAHDAGDRKLLADYTTPAMLAELTRDADDDTARQPTEIVALQAEVLEAATEGDRHWASVRYTGTLREGGAASTSAFDEIWNLTKPVDGSSGWLLAGIQQPA